MGSEEPLGAVLVVGGCGFLGQHLVEMIAKTEGSNANISVLDLNIDRNRHPSATYYSADITERSQVAQVLSIVKPRVIFHTASPYPFTISHAVLENVNILGTRNLVDCAKDIGTIKAFVYTSSSSVVHDQVNPLINASEDMPLLHYPQQPYYYAHTKAVGEEIVLGANGVTGMLTVAIRPTTLYGEGDMLMTTSLTSVALKGRANIQIGENKHLYDTTYVGNCCHAEILAAKSLLSINLSLLSSVPKETRIAGEAFNVSNDEPLFYWTYFRMVAEIVGSPFRNEDVKHIPRWFMIMVGFVLEWMFWIFTWGNKRPTVSVWLVRLMTMERTFNIEKIKKRLGYRPLFSTREGFERGVRWYREKVEKEKNEQSEKKAK